MGTEKIKLSKIGLGAGVFSGNYDPVNLDIAQNTMKTAFENGINWLDTSPYYGNSEIIVGEALKNLSVDRSSYYISTKVGRYGPTKADFDYSKERVRQSIATSLERLHTTYLDFVFCHDVEFVDVNQVINETLPELFKMKQEGVVKNVGISGYPIDLLLEIARLQNEKGQPLDQVLSYCHATLHNQQAVASIPKLRGQNVKYVFMASLLSMGLLRSAKVPFWHPGSPELFAAVDRCKLISLKYNLELQDVALPAAFLYSFNKSLLPNSTSDSDSGNFVATSADSCLVGMIGDDQVHTAIDALELASLVASLEPANFNKPTEKVNQFKQALEEIEQELVPFKSYSWQSPPEDA